MAGSTPVRDGGDIGEQLNQPNSVKIYRRGVAEQLNLPIGFRFRPTDEELVHQYLIRKSFSYPLPCEVIQEFEVFQTCPFDFPGQAKEKRYFFTRRGENEARRKRKLTGDKSCGYWKVNGKEKKLMAPGTTTGDRPVAIKKTMFFYHVKNAVAEKTCWAMDEYSLDHPLVYPVPGQKVVLKSEDWTVCCIYKKKRRAETRGVEMMTVDEENNNNGDIGSDPQSPSSSSSTSSCSSGMTELSSDEN